jgi:hypothetical protein
LSCDTLNSIKIFRDTLEVQLQKNSEKFHDLFFSKVFRKNRGFFWTFLKNLATHLAVLGDTAVTHRLATTDVN